MLPTTIAEWLQLGLVVFGILSGVATAIWRTSRLATSVEKGFHSQGERLGALEQDAAKHQEAISALQTKDQAHEFKMLQLTDSQGQLTGRIEQLVETLERTTEKKNAREVEIADRLARIETRLEIALGAREKGS